jgi:osmotically-inducible protein OsmY
VQLSGFVSTQAQKDAATKVAQAVTGVKSVQNGLTIKK